MPTSVSIAFAKLANPTERFSPALQKTTMTNGRSAQGCSEAAAATW
jgi:hypothetical protein